ncbi:hypothetical protein FBU30_000795 [Linnemannia zychae]|nr:hypothetical protein FBU30_000795 [Linnemannia zychae]
MKNSVIPEEDSILEDITQALRPINKNIRPNDIAPASSDEIIYVDCQIDPISKKFIVLWDDILQAFRDAEQVRYKARIIPFLKDASFNILTEIFINADKLVDRLQPKRIAAIPNAVLDVVVSNPIENFTTALSQVSVTKTMTRRNPVFGSEEQAMENLTHMDMPNAISTVSSVGRGPQAILDSEVSITIDTSTTTIDSPIRSSEDNSNNLQLLKRQSADIIVLNEMSQEPKITIASQGDKEAQVDLGDIYKGDLGGVEKDYNRAMDWYLKAAEQGDSSAQYNIGYLYDNGHGVQQDYSLAMTWYKKAAEQGHTSAQFAVGSMYENGYSVPKDYLTAMIWFRRAADKGHSDAQNNIGNLYLNGHGVQQDYSQAMNWYKKAAEQGVANAQLVIGCLYYNGHGVQQDYSQAMNWFKRAAEQGHATAQTNIGSLYECGHGVQQDYSQAMNWFKRAAEQGHATAQTNIGSLYECGHGVQQDYSLAMTWYKKAAEQGNANAQINIGNLYLNGHGVQQDYSLAMNWYKKAAEQGNANAQLVIGCFYQYGLGVQKDKAMAKIWYQKAAEQGHEDKESTIFKTWSIPHSNGERGLLIGTLNDSNKANVKQAV